MRDPIIYYITVAFAIIAIVVGFIVGVIQGYVLNLALDSLFQAGKQAENTLGSQSNMTDKVEKTAQTSLSINNIIDTVLLITKIIVVILLPLARIFEKR